MLKPMLDEDLAYPLSLEEALLQFRIYGAGVAGEPEITISSTGK
jgi:hypothetical protein